MDIKKDFYYKVKYGYGAGDFATVKNNEVQKAIYGMRAEKPVQLGDRIVDGARIISIEPHYHKYTGWHEWYEPKDGEDFAQIKRDCPDFTGKIQEHTSVVMGLMSTGNVKLVGTITPGTSEAAALSAKNPIAGISQLAEQKKIGSSLKNE